MRDTQQYPSQPGHGSIWTSRFREASLASLRRRSCIRRRIRPPKMMTRIPAATEPIVMPVVCPDVSRFASVWSTLVTRRRAASRGTVCGIDRCMPFTASFGRPGTIIARDVSVWTRAYTRYLLKRSRLTVLSERKIDLQHSRVATALLRPWMVVRSQRYVSSSRRVGRHQIDWILCSKTGNTKD